MPKETKITKIELDIRLNVVEELLLQGRTRRTIVRVGNSEEYNWNVQPRQIDEYISKCRKKWELELNSKFKENLAEHIKIRQRLFTRAYDNNQDKLALEIQKDIADLQGLYKQRVDMNGHMEIRLKLPKDVDLN